MCNAEARALSSRLVEEMGRDSDAEAWNARGEPETTHHLLGSKIRGQSRVSEKEGSHRSGQNSL